MKLKKWISAAAITFVVASSTFTTMANAESEKTIADESIYDLLVDRYYNGSSENDYETNPKDSTKFAGGDFVGVVKKIDRIKKMGFSIVSVGSVFSTEKYDGSMVTSYSQLERHFGTEKEFHQLIDTFKQNNISIMVDFPLSNVSANHEWAKDSAKKDWVKSTADGKVHWDLKSKDVQNALKEQIVNFVTTYKVGGVRLTNLDNADTTFVNELIKAIKDVDRSIYVISNEESNADFDAAFYNDTNEIFRNAFKNVDLDTSQVTKHVDGYLSNNEKPALLMLDNLWTNRFALDADKENMYVPTRMKMGVAPTLLLPGVPMMQYGTEIAVNGEAGPKSHQLYNFKTDDELVGYIEDILILRNQSETLRNGKFELLKNEDGLLAFKRTSDEETWIVLINNTSKTVRVDVTEDEIGKDKEVKGILNGDVIRANDTGKYPLVQDRETVEAYKVYDKSGINYPFMVALILVYILFVVFIVMLLKQAKKNKKK